MGNLNSRMCELLFSKHEQNGHVEQENVISPSQPSSALDSPEDKQPSTPPSASESPLDQAAVKPAPEAAPPLEMDTHEKVEEEPEPKSKFVVDQILLPMEDPRVAEAAWAHLPPEVLPNPCGPPEVPRNLFFTVNGKVAMPVFSMTVLREFARNRKRCLPSSSSSSSDDEDDKPLMSYDEDGMVVNDESSECSNPKKLRMRRFVAPKSSVTSAGAPKRKAAKSMKTCDCQLCGLQFPARNRLAGHLITHADREPFDCLLCTRHFNSKEMLVKHLGHWHRGMPRK